MQERSRSKSIQASESIPVVILITLSGGLQDAYTYIVRDGVFANAQTGNIVLLSEALFSLNWGRAFSYFIPVAAFALGILSSAFLRHRFQNHEGHMHWRHLVVAMEMLMLTAVAFIPPESSHAANALVSFACAMQVEAFRKARGYAYASTMCIGNLRSCMESLADYISGKDRRSLRKAGYYASVILTFAFGAGIGALLSLRFGIHTVLISSFLLFLSFLLMIRR